MHDKSTTKNKLYKQSKELILVFIALIFGVISHYIAVQAPVIYTAAQTIADLFMKFLQLMSTPIIFLAIITNFLSLSNHKNLEYIGKKIIFYTILTTFTAAFIAYLLFNLIDPTTSVIYNQVITTTPQHISYLTEALNVFPNNIVNAFAQNNVLGVAIIALIMGIAMMQLPKQQQDNLLPIFSSLFNAFINIARFITLVLPLGVWSFTVLFCKSMSEQAITFNGLGKYILIVIAANLIQGLIVLPLILKSKNLSPVKLFKSVSPALTTAFFSKSSSAALPLTMECMTKQHDCQEELTKFSLPICTIINMNGCAAFIYTTVLFVAVQSGLQFSSFDYILWIFIATIVAIGNASVPMGCYFLSSAILVGMGVPLTIMGLILPLYTFIDMVETALNVWSDCCVTDIVASANYQKNFLDSNLSNEIAPAPLHNNVPNKIAQ